eukprot:303548_1
MAAKVDVSKGCIGVVVAIVMCVFFLIAMFANRLASYSYTLDPCNFDVYCRFADVKSCVKACPNVATGCETLSYSNANMSGEGGAAIVCMLLNIVGFIVLLIAILSIFLTMVPQIYKLAKFAKWLIIGASVCALLAALAFIIGAGDCLSGDSSLSWTPIVDIIIFIGLIVAFVLIHLEFGASEPSVTKK